ncbi:hypothetical protein K470DRAFT_255458 [Piedraia hortae CBS 480.64]|uniref:Uncharacterized protein n=1 Tax=Piedraia hortae CBS 480.64 TaxID=1314780 RepID=A0A6A7C612_9PEZI|nr:hypothetical protein K470DRAFT_255458 [Piedraia hortae CBS 480.64]
MPLSMNETMTHLRENFLYRGKNPEKFRLLSMVLVMCCKTSLLRHNLAQHRLQRTRGPVR